MNNLHTLEVVVKGHQQAVLRDVRQEQLLAQLATPAPARRPASRPAWLRPFRFGFRLARLATARARG